MSLKLKKVFSRLSGEGDNIEWLECSGRHPPIEMIHTIPTKLEPSILQGWPPQSIECYSIGHYLFFSRTYSTITQLNPKGYTMRLIDLSGMVVVDGCSRGAVINGNRDYMVIHHGVIGDVRGYGVSALDVNEFLVKFGLISS